MIGSIFPECHRSGGEIAPQAKQSWKWAAAIAAVGLLGWFLYSQLAERRFDWGLFAGSLSGIHWGWIALSIVFLYATYYGRALRWAVLLRPLRPHPSIGNLLRATVIGFAAITLFGRPGEIVRPYLIATREGVSLTSQLAAWLIERIYDLLMALLVFGFALSQVKRSGLRVGPALSWVLEWGGQSVAVICAVLIVMVVLFRHFAEPIRRRLLDSLGFLPHPHFVRAEKLITSFVQGVESTRSDAALLWLLFYSIIEWILIGACYWCVARAFAHLLNLSLVDILIYMGFVSFGAVVQIPGIGGGTQLVSVLVLTELFGIRLEVATGFSLFIWLITFVVVVPVGLFAALREGLNWRGLRRIGREAAE